MAQQAVVCGSTGRVTGVKARIRIIDDVGALNLDERSLDDR